MNNCKLNELPINHMGSIIDLEASKDLRRRLLDLGLVKGTCIKPLFISPSGDPRAYEVRGSIIALRCSDAKLIKIKYL